jgi:hypothetical protein
MGDTAHSKALLALGCKLVEELGLDDSTDTLGRWMAHHIADLMIRAERATGEDKKPLEKECFELILALWKHLAELPNGKRPFEELEPVVRAIESLDPEDDTPRYYRLARPPKGQVEEQSDAERWLDFVAGLDYTAKLLIACCLRSAADSAVDKSKEWVRLAEAAGIKDGVPQLVIRFVTTKEDLGKEPDPTSDVRRALEDRLKRLDGFAKMAEALRSDLQAQLDGLSPATERDDDIEQIVMSSAPSLE